VSRGYGHDEVLDCLFRKPAMVRMERGMDCGSMAIQPSRPRKLGQSAGKSFGAASTVRACRRG